MYAIREGYQHREIVPPWDDTEEGSKWQREVYVRARAWTDRLQLYSVLDIGCGNASKLLEFFGTKVTAGSEISPNYEWLLQTHPERTWINGEGFVERPEFDVGLAIAADIIEHLQDPDKLMKYIFEVNPELVVISTPDRSLAVGQEEGPPFHAWHMREWNYTEFENYVGQYLDIIEHFYSSIENRTQVIVGRII